MLTDNLQTPRSPNLTNVKPDFTPQPEQDTINQGSLESKSTNEEVAKHMTTDEDQTTSCSQSTSQPCSLAPTRTNSFAGQQRPRLASNCSVQTARIWAGSLDTPPAPAAHDHPPSNTHPNHFPAHYSVGAADRRPINRNLGSSYFRPVAASLPSFSSPVRSDPVFASLTYPSTYLIVL